MIGIIRKFIKFKGIIISDDICMKALSKNYLYNAKKAIQLDAIWYCIVDGNIIEMRIIEQK